ncbi:MAG: RHS repeat-associated core domain-containing protein [Myxococcales bacterium]
MLLVDGRVLLIDERTLLVDGRALLVDERTLLVDGRALLVDERVLLVDGRRLLVDGRLLLVDGHVLLVDGRGLLRRKPPTAANTTGSDHGSTPVIPSPWPEVQYVYDDGNPDRVSAVQTYLWNGSTWVVQPVLSHVDWEPYGGLRDYQITFEDGDSGVVEYLHGAAGSEPSACPTGVSGLGSDDATGRLRAAWVSTGALNPGSMAGDIMKLVYTWQADQVADRDSCVLTTTASTPERESFNAADFTLTQKDAGYDQLLRVSHAEMPNQTSTGGPYRVQDFNYDARGNLSGTQTLDSSAQMVPGYAGGFLPDEMTSWKSASAASAIDYGYTYDADGRVAQESWAVDSSLDAGQTISFIYGLSWGLDGGSSGLENIKTVSIATGANAPVPYNYYYDAFQRRRFKQFPVAGVDNEYFYDTGHQMLEDRVAYTSTLDAPYPEDDYIWLDGRPVAYVRGQISSTWTRTTETYPGPTCPRMSDTSGAQACGIYPIVSDHIGKPILALEPNRLIAGVYSYSVHGALNRHYWQADSQHPYAPYSPEGTSTCGTDTSNIIGSLTERAPTTGVGLYVEDEFRPHAVDTQWYFRWPLGMTALDYGELQYVSSGNCFAEIGGYHRGPYLTGWTAPMLDSDQLNAAFYSTSPQECPNGPYLDCTCSACSQSGTCSTCKFPYTGISMEAVDYQVGQTTSPLSLPLRFPGQYYDAETDLHENWNRFYDPNTGRYLEPEPMLSRGTALGTGLVRSLPARIYPKLPVYAYAQGNPISKSDDNGLYGTTCCSYYAQECAATASSGVTQNSYYCTLGTLMCNITPTPPGESQWSNCVRKCLQDLDPGKTPGGCPSGRSASTLNNIIIHAVCFKECALEPPAVPDDPPGDCL